MSKDNISTFQTRIDAHPALRAYADRYNLVEHKLYAQILAGKRPNKLKQAFLVKYGTDYAIIDSDYGEYPGEEVAGKISWTRSYSVRKSWIGGRRSSALGLDFPPNYMLISDTIEHVDQGQAK